MPVISFWVASQDCQKESVILLLEIKKIKVTNNRIIETKDNNRTIKKTAASC